MGTELNESRRYDVVIVGAGPAGLFCAIHCAIGGRSVLVLEKNTRPGRKLLVTGSGQCNITNTAPLGDFCKSYGEKERFVKNSLYKFSNTAVIDFFSSHNLSLITTPQGKVFPKSMLSSDVLNVLLKECNRLGVTVRTGDPVVRCQATEQGQSSVTDRAFLTTTSTGIYSSAILVLSTGSPTWPKTGSTGDGVSLAKSMGQPVTDFFPALSPVVLNPHRFQSCAGNTLKIVHIQLYRDGKLIKQTRGDILITHRGLSGPTILNFSRYILPDDILVLNLFSGKTAEQLNQDLLDCCNHSGKKQVKNLLTGWGLPDSLAIEILHQAKIELLETAAHLSKKDRLVLIDLLISHRLVVAALGSFDEAMVARGGILLSHINPKTMESTNYRGLFFCGEVIDIDGDTGGYNLQFAFSSAYSAAEAINKRTQSFAEC